MTFLYPFFANILASFIDYLRIKLSFGKVQNVDKFWTISIAIVFFALCLDLSFSYYDEISPLKVLVYLIYFSFVRLLIYSPILNLLRGLPILYRSKTTNSKVDQFLNNYNISPLLVVNFAILGTILFGYIWFKIM
jgi:hypothetical protein